MALDSAGDFVVTWVAYGGQVDPRPALQRRGRCAGQYFTVNTYTQSGENRPSIAMDSAGDFVITWDSYGEDGSLEGVYAQRFNAAGTAQGTEFRVNSYTAGNQSFPTAAMDSAGDFVIAYMSNGEDGSGYGIFAQRYNATGAPRCRVFRQQVHDRRSGVSLGGNGLAGRFRRHLVGQRRGGDAIYAQGFNAAGTAQGSQFQVSSDTQTDTISAVAMDVSGDFVVNWGGGQFTNDRYVFGQRYNATGVAQGEEFQVNTNTAVGQNPPAVAVDAEGDFVAVWEGNTDGSQYGIYAQRYLVQPASPAIARAGSEFQVNTYTTRMQELPKVASDAAGDYVVVWESQGQDGSGYGVYARRTRGGPGARERVPRQHGYHRQPGNPNYNQWWPSGGHGFGRRFRRRLDELWRGWQYGRRLCPAYNSSGVTRRERVPRQHVYDRRSRQPDGGHGLGR